MYKFQVLICYKIVALLIFAVNNAIVHVGVFSTCDQIAYKLHITITKYESLQVSIFIQAFHIYDRLLYPTNACEWTYSSLKCLPFKVIQVFVNSFFYLILNKRELNKKNVHKTTLKSYQSQNSRREFQLRRCCISSMICMYDTFSHFSAVCLVFNVHSTFIHCDGSNSSHFPSTSSGKQETHRIFALYSRGLRIHPFFSSLLCITPSLSKFFTRKESNYQQKKLVCRVGIYLVRDKNLLRT